jgi:hypothetical protein
VERVEQAVAVHPVQRLTDGHRAECAHAEQRTDHRYVGVGADHPAQVGPARGDPAGFGEHVRFRVHPDDGPDPLRDRQRELPGPAAQVEDHVIARQAERRHQGVDHLGGIPPPIPLVEPSHLTTEPQLHVTTLSGPP